MVLGDETPRQMACHPAGDHEGPVRAGERLTERLDCPTIQLARMGEVREIVVERQMDDAVGVVGTASETFEIRQITPVRLGPGLLEHPLRGIRTGEPHHLMAGADELGEHGRADKAGRTRDKDLHIRTPPVMSVTVIDSTP